MIYTDVQMVDIDVKKRLILMPMKWNDTNFIAVNIVLTKNVKMVDIDDQKVDMQVSNSFTFCDKILICF